MNNIRVTEINPNFSVVSEVIPNLESAALGVFFSCGSRYENEAERGVNHLIEHLLFKGTHKKGASEIAKFVESKGAIIDGFTTKETSGIYSRYFANNFDDISGLINEIILSSNFNADLLEKEKNIIINEINESRDNPEESVFLLLNQALFDKHPMAFPIDGTLESIANINREQVIEYYQKKFLRSKICVSATGKIDHDKLVDSFSVLDRADIASKPQQSVRPKTNIERLRITEVRKDLSQLYSAAGSFTFSYSDDERYGMILLNNIWGSSMSSRLFNRIREQEGLVYSIFTFIDLYSDIGVIGAFYISDPKNQQRIYECGYEETVKIQQSGITQNDLERAVNYCKSLLVLGNEDPMSRMIRNAKHQLLLNRIVTIKDSIAKFENYDTAAINTLTQQLPLDYSVVNITPVDQSDNIKKSGGPQHVIRDQR